MIYGKKFWGKLTLGLFIVLFSSLFVFGFDSQAASLRGKNNEEKIFYFLLEKMDMNSAAGAGVIANIQYESSFKPNALGDGGTSYGICQWHALRYENLKRFCERNGFNYTKLDGQLNFLKYELESDYYYNRNVLAPIKAVPNTSQGAYNAAYVWCCKFEIPADKETKGDIRGQLAKKKFDDKYKNIVLKLIAGNSYTIDEGAFIALSEKAVSFAAPADKKASSIVIPDKIKIGDITAKVVEIAPNACKKCKKATQVTIGKNVKKIGDKAFYACKKLDTIKIKSTKISTFGDDSFSKIKKGATFYVKKAAKRKYSKALKDVTSSKISVKAWK